jgi:hypothetical protein
MAAQYKVLSTQPWIYTDQTGRIIRGFRIFVSLLEFNETHELELPSLDPAAVKTAVEALVTQRKALSAL